MFDLRGGGRGVGEADRLGRMLVCPHHAQRVRLFVKLPPTAQWVSALRQETLAVGEHADAHGASALRQRALRQETPSECTQPGAWHSASGVRLRQQTHETYKCTQAGRRQQGQGHHCPPSNCGPVRYVMRVPVSTLKGGDAARVRNRVQQRVCWHMGRWVGTLIGTESPITGASAVVAGSESVETESTGSAATLPPHPPIVESLPDPPAACLTCPTSHKQSHPNAAFACLGLALQAQLWEHRKLASLVNRDWEVEMRDSLSKEGVPLREEEPSLPGLHPTDEHALLFLTQI